MKSIAPLWIQLLEHVSMLHRSSKSLPDFQEPALGCPNSNPVTLLVAFTRHLLATNRTIFHKLNLANKLVIAG